MPSTHLWQPELLDMSQESHRIRWESLKASGTVLEVHDTLDAQVAEWAICHAPAAKHDPTLLASTLATLMEGRDWDTFGVWVHYPWSGRLVHVLPEEAFVAVRTNRNRDKITEEETRRLRDTTVGIVGLSVGQSTAIALAMERAAGTLKLADFDVVELSNMNRIRCGLHELELPKWVVAARAIAEFDPFLRVEIFDEGLTPDNVKAFVEGCNVLVDAFDTLSAKALLRLHAQTSGILVVMGTKRPRHAGRREVRRPRRVRGRVCSRPHRPGDHGALRRGPWLDTRSTRRVRGRCVRIGAWAAEFGPSRNHLGQLAPNLHRRCGRRRARRGSLPTSGIGRVAPRQTNLHGPS